MKPSLTSFLLFLCGITSAIIPAQADPKTPSIVWNALKDFDKLGEGDVPYYKDKKFKALAIDAATVSYRGKFAQATRTFDGESGKYDIHITTLTEEDGESTYNLKINGKEVASFTNPHIGEGSDLDLEPHHHKLANIRVEKGDSVTISSDARTNGEIPENGGTAWSRGRWREIEFSEAENRPLFDKSTDILIAQFDSKPDADDVMAQAALASMLKHPDFSGVNFHVIAGAVGTQKGKYINTRSLMEMGFGEENTAWSDAKADWESSVARIVEKSKRILEGGGKVWVQEAGQSDITADWVAALRKKGISEEVIKGSVIVVQHSPWNEDHTTPDDLAYVKRSTDYRAIDDGNADTGDFSKRPSRGAETPGYVNKNPSWLVKATSPKNPNKIARKLWAEADRIIKETGFSAGYSEIPGGGIDFSDTVEIWWIFNLEARAKDVPSFWARYVTNNPSEGN